MRANKVGTSLWSDALTTNPVHKVRQTQAFYSTYSLSEGLILTETELCYLAIPYLSTGTRPEWKWTFSSPWVKDFNALSRKRAKKSIHKQKFLGGVTYATTPARYHPRT